jgi:hypothetical protein
MSTRQATNTTAPASPAKEHAMATFELIEKSATPVIELQDVQSSQIHSIGHDPVENVLAIRFYRGWGRDQVPGPLYHYQNISAEEFAALRDAESIGRHFGQQIKPFSDKHPYTRIDEGGPDEAQAA